jgi:spore maturation protein SpmB
MCTFLAINTSSVQLLPLTAIGVLAIHNASNPSVIVGPAILATICSTIAGIAAVKWMERWRMFRLPPAPERPDASGERTEPAEAGTPNAPSARERSSDSPVRSPQSTDGDADRKVSALVDSEVQPMTLWGKLVLFAFLGCFAWVFFSLVFGDLAPAGDNHFLRTVKAASTLAVPFLIAFFPLFAALKRIKVYEEFVEGGKEGLQVAFRIVPYLVAILVAVGMFRGAGGIQFVTDALRPVLGWIGFPSELVPMCLMRPLSGSGTLGMFTDLVQAHGANSLLATMGGAIFGSTETTLYVVAVYFGSVSVRRSRHAVPAGLFADGVGMIASVWICRWMFT